MLPDYTITHQFTDNTGKKSTAIHYFSGVHADAVNYANTLSSALDALSDSTISAVYLTETIDTDPTIPAGHVDNEVGGQFTFVNEDGLTMRVTVPGIKESLVLAGSKQLNPDSAFVLAYQAAVRDTIGAVDSRNGDLVSERNAYEAFRGKVDPKARN